MGVSFPAITFRAPSQHRREMQPTIATSSLSSSGSKPKKRRAAFGGDRLGGRRRRKWWQLCRDGDAKPASLGEFLEVERRFGDGAFYGATAELEGVMGTPPLHDEHQEERNGRVLFADGRVLPPAPQPPSDGDDEGTSTAGVLCRFPVSLTGICSGGVG
ncbi:hypothetical protein COLO4_04996 [Corchorus olitorius]|uniref:Uncharacterized protein n=1 Tax=Corchorus olitorius TaxID=93759 RepID=A0A1R3KS80_9ROSI|nr:hypothetical protein COLO4_04996 [Corchorus olitorius]